MTHRGKSSPILVYCHFVPRLSDVPLPLFIYRPLMTVEYMLCFLSFRIPATDSRFAFLLRVLIMRNLFVI